MRRIHSPALALFVLLGACADTSSYPSLAPRPIESAARESAAAPAAPGVVAASDAGRDARAAALVDQAVEGDAAFAKLAAEACRAVPAGLGAAEGSEAWVAAQQSLSALDAARAPVQSAAAELDQLLIAGSDAAGAPVDTSRLAGAAAQVNALDAVEQARVEAISAGRCAG